MSGLRFVPLGVGDTFTTRWFTTCFAVESEGRWVLIDAPHPLRRMVVEGTRAAGVPIDLDAIEAVIVTHLHGDHVSGLEGFGWYSTFALGRRAVVYAHPLVKADLWDGCLRGAMGRWDDGGETRQHKLDTWFDVRDLSLDAPTAVGPFEVSCRRTRHAIPTTALRLRAGGACLGHSSDTSFDPELLAWLDEADLVTHECNLGIHTDYAALAALPADARQKMRLYHYTDEFDLDSSAIEPLRQGALYTVAPRR